MSFIIGFIIGFIGGLLIMACLAAASRADEEIERFSHREDKDERQN